MRRFIYPSGLEGSSADQDHTRSSMPTGEQDDRVPPGQPLQATTQQSPGVEDPDATQSAIDQSPGEHPPPGKKQRQDDPGDAGLVDRAAATITDAARNAGAALKQSTLNTTREAVLWAESDGVDKAKAAADAASAKANDVHAAVTQKAAGVQEKAGAAISAVVDRSKALAERVESSVIAGVKSTLTSAGKMLQGAGGELEKMAADPTELEMQAGATKMLCAW